MKSLAGRRCSEERLLLRVTLLLSLVGLRPELDLYVRRAPETLHAGWAPLHPKCPDRDWDRLLREVRALGAPYIPSTRVEAWLVHVVAAGEGNGAPRSSPVSGAGGGGPSESSAREGPGFPDSARGSSLQAQGGEIAAVPEAEATPEGSDCRSLEDSDLITGLEILDYCFPQKGNEESESQEGEEKVKQVNDEENEKKAEPEEEETENTDSTIESNRNSIDSSPFLEEYMQLPSSQTENSLEGIIENTSSTSQSTAGLVHDNSVEESWQDFLLSSELQENSSPTHYSINLTHMISHDVSLHEAMLLRANHSTWSNPEIRNVQQQEPFLQLNSSNTNPESLLNGTNLGLFPSVDIRNLTNQDILSDLDENVFGEINLMALALEEGFDPMEVSQLFEEPDSDSGLSLNSSHSKASSNNSTSSSVSTCDKDAVGYISDSELTSHSDLGAVGGHYPEHTKHCHMGYQNDSNCCGVTTLQHILHNHTYNQLPNELASTSEHYPSYEKSKTVKGTCLNSTNKYLSHDERHVKALRIPFSVDEIVSVPVEAFNNMLSKFYLSETQISLMRDVRRRGKNKVAAQNCRKRKLDVILNLEDEVCHLQAQKERLKKQKSQCSKSINCMKQKLNYLYHIIFSRLRDDQGRPVNPSHYALHCSNNGCILVIPKRLVTSEQKQENQKGQKQK